MNYLILDAQNLTFSLGTVLAEQLPDGFTYVVLSDEDYEGMIHQGYWWNAETSTIEKPEVNNGN